MSTLAMEILHTTVSYNIAICQTADSTESVCTTMEWELKDLKII